MYFTNLYVLPSLPKFIKEKTNKQTNKKKNRKNKKY